MLHPEWLVSALSLSHIRRLYFAFRFINYIPERADLLGWPILYTSERVTVRPENQLRVQVIGLAGASC